MSQPAPTDRRKAPDRRNAASRRRHAESRALSVELCQSVLRVALVIDGNPKEPPLLRCWTVRWREEARDLPSEQGRAELTAALRRIVSEERLAGCSVSLAISSELCVNRATSGPTAQVEQEIADLHDRSQMYLSLGPGPKTTAVGRKHLDARHEHALVSVTNEQTLELLVEAAEAAGLTVDVVESALVALSRLQGQLEPDEERPVVLAKHDEDRFEIGVSRQGQLLLEYRPPASATLARLGEVVNEHFERLQRFCGRQYGASADKLERMWIAGEPGEVTASNTRVARQLETEALPLERLDRLWRLDDEQTVSAEMGAALGLALRGRVDESGINPNLMDERHARAKAPLKPFLMRAAAPIAATLLAASGLWLYNLERRAELNVLKEQVAQLTPERLRGERLGKEIVDSAVEIQHLTKLVERSPKQPLTPVVSRLGSCLPDDVWLKDLRLSEGEQVTVSGASYTESGVYDFVRYLEEAPDFREVALRGTGLEQTPKGPATSFDIDLELAPAPTAPQGGKP